MNRCVSALVLIVLITGILACKKSVYTLNTDQGPKVSDVIWFTSISNPSVIADSASYTEIGIALKPQADTAFSSIKMKTTKGLFSNGTQEMLVKVNANKQIKVQLFAGREDGPAFISATVNSISIDTTINMLKALPDYLQLQPTVLATNKSVLKLGLELIRDSGKAGKKIKIDLSYQSLDTTNVVLNIVPFSIIENVRDSISISNPFNLKGRVEIVARTFNQHKDIISAKALVVFQ
jgi:hypothetical protein